MPKRWHMYYFALTLFLNPPSPEYQNSQQAPHQEALQELTKSEWSPNQIIYMTRLGSLHKRLLNSYKMSGISLGLIATKACSEWGADPDSSLAVFLG